MNKHTQIIFLLIAMLPWFVQAEQAYIIDQTQVGLHKEKNVDSPIVKLLNTGNSLQILQRSDNMTEVTTEEGIQGWIKNEYLMNQSSSRDELEQLKKQNLELIAQLQEIPSETSNTVNQTSDSEQIQKLENELKAEKLHSGKLEAELLEQKQKARDGDNAELYQHIANLEQENLKLKEEKEKILNPNAELSMFDDIKRLYHRRDELRRYLVYALLLLVAGIVGGIFITDYIHRQRHGGFRV